MLRNALLSLALAFFFCTCSAFAQQAAAVKHTPSKEDQLVTSLLGTWEIDLKPSPEANSYLKEFTITRYEEGTLHGYFYDTPFKDGKINTAWDKIYFAFTTADNAGTYYHSGYLENNKLHGTSFSTARGFMLPWVSVRKK